MGLQSAWIRYFDETFGSATFRYAGKDKSEQEVLSLLHNPKREVRREAHVSLSDGFNKLSRSLTFIFNTLLADKATNDELRGYPSWIHARNLSNETDDITVNALVKAVTGHYEWVQRYYKLKSKLLGIEDFKDFDRYAPLKDRDNDPLGASPFDGIDAYGEFSPKMADIAARFFDEKWIDAAIQPEKRGGHTQQVLFLLFTRMYL